ncbi:WG containing repeat-containing protein [Saccharicrinis carchari]|uniref:WG containing repeat-containing protein n=1 Tax=Saccharicrinis carchari TaxID=1168039 RepID=A0A521CLQ6_SACCC|nr:WG repeat-containing protein [Saccharicrinis carchari]SMO60356.1 WG containing repeat-containing protein [Saccharicrinis carchari]
MKYLSILLFAILLPLFINAQDKQFLKAYDKVWEIEEGYYRVMDNGKIGLINQWGDVIIPCENDQVWNLRDNGNVRVLKKGKLGVYNTNGDVVIPLLYDMIWDFEEGRARVLRNGKVGYVNAYGNEFIPCKYDQIWGFEDGKARVLLNGKTGYVNLSGYEFIPAQYQKIWPFEDGRAKVLKNGKMGYINLQGVEIIDCLYQHIGDFEDGVARVIKNGEISYIDIRGNPVNSIKAADLKTTPDSLAIESDDSDVDNSMRLSNHNQVDGDTTVIRVFGSRIEVVDKDEAREFSVGKSSHIYSEAKNIKNNRLFKGHYWGVDIGLNNYINSNGDFSLANDYRYLSLNSGKSVEFSLNALQQNISLSRKGNVGLVSGLGLNYNNYRFDNPNIPIVDESGNLAPQPITVGLEKNKLTTLYLTVPLLFEVQFSQRNRNAFYVSAGVIGAYKLRSHTKIVTKQEGDRNKEKNRSSFGLNEFRYGAQVRFGYKALNFYGSYYFTPLFQKGRGPELYPVSLGVALYPGRW